MGRGPRASRASSSALLEHLHDLFAPLGALSTRPMFGGHGVYVDGVIIGIVLDDALYLKADAASRGCFEAAGCRPAVHGMAGRTLTLSYWSVPEAAMESPQAMGPWARRALEAAWRKRGGAP